MIGSPNHDSRSSSVGGATTAALWHFLLLLPGCPRSILLLLLLVAFFVFFLPDKDISLLSILPTATARSSFFLLLLRDK